MRLFFILSISILLPFGIFAQEPLSLEEILSDASEANRDLKKIEALNVVGYHKLYEEYDTELKIKVFKKSEWYKEKENELKELRTEQRKSIFFYKDSKSFDELTYSMKHKGFLVEIGSDFEISPDLGRPFKTIDTMDDSMPNGEVYLKNIPTIKIKMTDTYDDSIREYVVIKTTEETGLEIEENKERVTIYFLFKPIRMEKIKFKFTSPFNPENYLINTLYTKTSSYLTSDFLRIIVANDDSGKIYYDKIIHK